MNDLLKTEKDKEVWERLLIDLNRPHDVQKNQIMKQWDFLYRRWFSKEVDLKALKKCFEQEVDNAERRRYE